MPRRSGKRVQRKREQARARGGSPYELAARRGELVACYINSGWREDGKASIYMLHRVPGGGHVFAAFLIDLWCMGLKEAYGRLDMSYTEFQEGVLEGTRAELELVRIDLPTVRRLVAGGIRFAEQNGFRLPPRYERWVALLGNIGDPQEADLTEFGWDDGRLYYMGSREDLRRRLMGCTVDEFLKRKDVESTIGDDNFTLVDDDTLAVEHVADVVRQKVLSVVRQWCFANGRVPHPRLSDAWDLMAEAMMQTEDLAEDDTLDDNSAQDISARIAGLLSFETPEAEADVLAAMEQMQEFMQQYNSPDAFYQALDLEKELDPDEEG